MKNFKECGGMCSCQEDKMMEEILGEDTYKEKCPKGGYKNPKDDKCYSQVDDKKCSVQDSESGKTCDGKPVQEKSKRK